MKRRLISVCVLLLWVITYSITLVQPVLAQEWEDLSTDIDGDGLLNDLEISGWYNEAGGPFSTDPRDADSDDDGLTDGEEKLFDTHPLDDRDPGIYVKYEDHYKTIEYFRPEDQNPIYPSDDPDVFPKKAGYAYLLTRQAGEKYLMLPEGGDGGIVVRRGTTIHIGGPSDATFSISGSGLTDLTSYIERDLYGGGWTVSFPAGGTVGVYTATMSVGGWQAQLPIYTIFELPPTSELDQAEIDAYLYNDDISDIRDETSVIWFTLKPTKYSRRCDDGYDLPCYNANNFYHKAYGWSQAFFTEQYRKWIFVDQVMPRIHGQTTQFAATDKLSIAADREVRVDYENFGGEVEGQPRSYQISYVLSRSDDGVGQTQTGTACHSQAGTLSAFLRSAGIPAQPFITDWNWAQYDTSVRVWLNNQWYAARSYDGEEVEDRCEDKDCHHYPFTGGHTDQRPLHQWDSYGQYREDNSEIIVTANENWNWEMVNTGNVYDEKSGATREYAWDSIKPLELEDKYPYVETMNTILWQGQSWLPSGWPTAYSLPDPYPGGDTNENWPIEPVPQDCPTGFTGICPYPPAGTMAASVSVDSMPRFETGNAPHQVYLPLVAHSISEMSAQPGQVQFGAVLGDFGIDTDGNGRFDKLLVEVQVMASRAGNYILGGALSIPEGKTAYGSVYADQAQVYLRAGLQKVIIPFDGLSISSTAADGPYQVESLWVTDLEEFDPRLGPWDQVLDHRQPDYVTLAYTVDQFEVWPASFGDEYTAQGVDQDRDGWYEAVAVDIALDIDQPSVYKVAGSLVDGSGDFVGYATWTGSKSPAKLMFGVEHTTPPYTLEQLHLRQVGGPLFDSRQRDAYMITDLGGLVDQGDVRVVKELANSGEIVPMGENITPTQVFNDRVVDSDSDGRYDELIIDVQVEVTQADEYWVEGWLQAPDGALVAYGSSDPVYLSVGSPLTLSLPFDGRAINGHGPVTGTYTVIALRVLDGDVAYDVLDEVQRTGLALSYDADDFEPVSTGALIFHDDMESGTGQWSSWQSPWSLASKTWPNETSLWRASTGGSADGSLETVTLDTSDYARPMLRFHGTYTIPTTSAGYIEASDGAAWTRVATYTSDLDRWTTGVIDLREYGEIPNLKLRFNADSQDGLLWYVDDVYVNAWPAVKSASFTYTPTVVVAGEVITYVGSYDSISTTLPMTYTWNFGDGTALQVTNDPTITHQYTVGITPTVRLTVENPYDDASAYRVLGVNEPIDDTSFDYTPSVPEAGDPVRFTAAYTPSGATPPITFTWNFGDSSTEITTTQTVTHTYAAGGTYNIRLTTSNGYGTANDSEVIQIEEGVASVSFVYDPATPIEGDPVDLTVNFAPDTASQPITYTWDWGNGDPLLTTTLANVQHTFAAWGDYDVEVTADNGYGSPAVYSSTIAIDGRPVADVSFVVAQAEPTDDYTAIFTPTHAPVNATQPVTYVWNFDDGTITDTVAPTITHEFTFTSATTFTVIVTATNSFETTPVTYSDQLVLPFDDDGDGLGNAYERSLGTDPQDDDTDDDGLSDGFEVTGYTYMGYSSHVDYGELITTSAVISDTDDDGLIDGFEVSIGTHPRDPDTDGDGLEDGDEPGLHGTADPLDPDTDDDGLEDGAEVHTHGTSPILSDTDEDGLTDGQEVNATATDPLDPDTDTDARTDGDEWYGYIYTHTITTTVYALHMDFGQLITTSAVISDTDGDDLTDGQEYDFGTHPVDTDTDDDGIDDRTETADNAGLVGSTPVDTDNDGDIDAFDDDSDDDGILDSVEGTGDVDNDGVPNWRDADDNYPPVAVDDDMTTAEDTPAATDVITNDTDLNGDTLTVTVVGPPTHGAVIHDSTTVTYTPDLDFFGSDSFTYTVSDGALTDTATVVVTVTAVQDAPTFTSTPVAAAAQDTLYTYVAIASDGDPGEVLTITAPVSPTWLALTATGNGTATLSGTPTNADVGQHAVLLQVVDTTGLTDTQPFTITVGDANDAPWFTSAPVEDATEDITYTYSITADDMDAGDALAFTAPVSPTWLTLAQVTSRTATLSGTPSNADVGDHAVELEVQDTGGLTDTQTFTITVANVNDAPVFTSAPVEDATEDAAYTYDVIAEDVDAGDALTITTPTLPDWLALMDNGDGTATLSGTPLNADVGQHAVTLQVRDASGLTDTQSFTVTVANTNDAPEFTSMPVTVATEDVTYTYNIAATDVDVGDVLGITATVRPSWLNITDHGNGTATLSGTPTNADVGDHAITLQVRDNGGAIGSQVFVITVANVNDAPWFTSMPVTAATEGVTYTYSITATDVDVGDTGELDITALTNPAWLTLTDRGSGVATLSGIPSNANVGDHTVTLQVEDDSGAVGTQSFTITVANVNDAPEFTSAPVEEATEDMAYTYDVTAEDADAGDVLTITAPTAPAWLGLTDDGDGTATLSGTPSNTDVGDHAVTLSVEDDDGAVGTQSFTITVANVNDAPEFTSTPVEEATEDVAYTYDVTAEDVDTDDVLTITAPTLSTWLTLTDNGDGTATLSGTPGSADVGDHAVELLVTDSGGLTDAQSFTITVTNVNDAPEFTSTPVEEATEDVAYTYDITAEDVDAGDVLTITAPTAPAWLGLTDNGDGTATLSGTPSNADVGDHAVLLHVEDSGGLTDTQTFTITVANVNDAPEFTSTPVEGATEDVAYTYDVTAEDVDAGDMLTITAPTLPTWLTLTDGGDGTATLSGTPGSADVGDHAVALLVEDSGGLTDTQSFTITVIAAGANTPPTITVIADQETTVNTPLGPIPFTIGDAETAAGDLVLSRETSDDVLIPLANIVLGGSGADRSVTITPAAELTGTAIITITVTDGEGLTDYTAFEVRVEPFSIYLPLVVRSG